MKNRIVSKIRTAALTGVKSLLEFMGIVAVGGSLAASCEEPAAMYGCPYSDYEVKGKVVDEQQKPIKGIVVTHNADYLKHFETGENRLEDINGKDFEAVTGDDGTFVMRVQSYVAPDSLYAVDIDGMANGGDFKTEGLKVELHEVDPPADRDSEYDQVWYEGAFQSQDMLFEMKPKE